jgi:PAS domain S-box-containing protein
VLAVAEGGLVEVVTAGGGLPADRLGGGRMDEQVAYLAALFEQSPAGLAVFDSRLRYLAVNPALAHISGLPPERHIGRRIPELLPDLSDELEGALRRVLETGTTLVGLLLTGTTPADPGRQHTWEASVFRLGSGDGHPLSVSVVLTDVTSREAARMLAEAAQSRLALVNEATGRIGTTLELNRTAAELVDVAVPRFADLATVDLLESLILVDDHPPERAERGATVRRVAARGITAEVAERLSQPLGSRHTYAEGDPAVHVLTSGRAVLIPRLAATAIQRTASGPVPAEHPRRAPPRETGSPEWSAVSLVVAPLTARGRVLGTASFVRHGNNRSFDEQDLAVAEELAARAGLAIDNARLYRRERRTAITLQRALLPKGRPPLTGVTVAHRYQPAGTDTEVGGDWFDALPLSCGRVALVIGDVMGHGLRAAAAMGQLRTAVHTLAVLDLMPDDVVAHLDHVARSLDGVQLATCVYAVYDPMDRSLSYASAGHPPPIVVHPDRSVEPLPPSSGAPLAVGGVPFESAEVTLPDDSTVVLYTDGLVGHRTSDGEQGMDRLRAALAAAPPDLDEMCEAVLRTAAPPDTSDDVALLVARVRGLPSERHLEWRVPGDLAAVGTARHLTAETLRSWRLGALEDIATLLVSEVVTNAIRYAREPILLRLLGLDDAFVCSVRDADARLPRLRRAGYDDEGGRGLRLVGMLSRRWGARPTRGGKWVWFELPLPG